MKDKTIESNKTSNFGLVKKSEYPTKRELSEFKYSMYILTEDDLFYFYEKKNRTDIMDQGLSVEQPKELKLTADALGKIKDLFKDVTLNKCYQLTEFSLKKLLEILENNSVTLKITQVTLRTKRKKVCHIDFPQLQLEILEEVPSQNSTNQSTDASKRGAADKPSDKSITTSYNSKTLSSELNKSIQDFLGTGRLKQNAKTNNNATSDALRSDEQLEHLKLDLLQKEIKYNKLLYAVKKTVGEVYAKTYATEKERSVIIASELAKIERTTTTQIKNLFINASIEQYKRDAPVLLKTIRTDSKDIDLSKIFSEKPFDLIKQLQTINPKPQTDLKQFVTELITVLNRAILKINQMYCPDTIKKIPKESDVEGSEEDFAQQYVDMHIDANKQLKEIKEQITSQLNSFEEDGYLSYISAKHQYKAREFAQDKSGIYFNEMSAIKQELEEKKQEAAKIQKKMIFDIHTAKSEKIAMAEMELYLNFGIDFSDLRKNFIETQKRIGELRHSKSSFTQQESESLQKKIELFMKMLKLEQLKRQEKIKDFESFLDEQRTLVSINIAPHFMISLVSCFKKEVNSYKFCDISLNELIRNINYAIQTHLTQENLEKLPYYGNQKKEFLLNFFDVMNVIFNLFDTDSTKTAHFFSREIKEIEYAKAFEQFTKIIANVTHLLGEQKEVQFIK